jgi:aldose sugar dehydrogenase
MESRLGVAARLRRREGWRILTAAAALGIVGIAPAAAQPGGPQQPPPRVVVVAEGLQNPWGLAFLPNGDLLVTERPGRLRIVSNGRLSEPVAGLPEVYASQQGGLLDVVLHPNFEQNRLVYLSYSKGNQQSATTVIARGRLDGTVLRDFEEILVADAWAPGGIQFGSRIVFDSDGYMFVSIGDRNVRPQLGQGASHPAQDLSNHNGTILRLFDDGRAPPDNPFVGTPGAKPEIWAYGFRNPQGLAFHPTTGELWLTEHGPQGGDELNLVVRGGNYGWPVIGYGVMYGGAQIHEHREMADMLQPVQFFTPSPGLSGLAFYSGTGFPAWNGSAFLGGMTGQVLYRIALNGTTVTQLQRVPINMAERIRDVRVGPDQFIYFLTDSAQGRIVRLEPGG